MDDDFLTLQLSLMFLWCVALRLLFDLITEKSLIFVLLFVLVYFLERNRGYLVTNSQMGANLIDVLHKKNGVLALTWLSAYCLLEDMVFVYYGRLCLIPSLVICILWGARHANMPTGMLNVLQFAFHCIFFSFRFHLFTVTQAFLLHLFWDLCLFLFSKHYTFLVNAKRSDEVARAVKERGGIRDANKFCIS